MEQVENNQNNTVESNKKDHLKRACKVLTPFTIILSLITLMYYLLPIFSVVIGLLAALLIVVFILVSVLGTLFIVIAIKEYRDWLTHAFDIPNFFFNIGKNMDKVAPYFPFVAFPSLLFCLILFLLSIIGQSKKKKGFIPFIVISAAFLVITLVSIILYYINGGHTIVVS